ncbi:hypothetical protein KAZ57_00720, partial [Patescibacteria group bacterium]|nr:hypothetical protein [Patescibacteria group bacterium]
MSKQKVDTGYDFDFRTTVIKNSWFLWRTFVPSAMVAALTIALHLVDVLDLSMVGLFIILNGITVGVVVLNKYARTPRLSRLVLKYPEKWQELYPQVLASFKNPTEDQEYLARYEAYIRLITHHRMSKKLEPRINLPVETSLTKRQRGTSTKEQKPIMTYDAREEEQTPPATNQNLQVLLVKYAPVMIFVLIVSWLMVIINFVVTLIKTPLGVGLLTIVIVLGIWGAYAFRPNKAPKEQTTGSGIGKATLTKALLGIATIAILSAGGFLAYRFSNTPASASAQTVGTSTPPTQVLNEVPHYTVFKPTESGFDPAFLEYSEKPHEQVLKSVEIVNSGVEKLMLAYEQLKASEQSAADFSVFLGKDATDGKITIAESYDFLTYALQGGLQEQTADGSVSFSMSFAEKLKTAEETANLSALWPPYEANEVSMHTAVVEAYAEIIAMVTELNEVARVIAEAPEGQLTTEARSKALEHFTAAYGHQEAYEVKVALVNSLMQLTVTQMNEAVTAQATESTVVFDGVFLTSIAGYVEKLQEQFKVVKVKTIEMTATPLPATATPEVTPRAESMAQESVKVAPTLEGFANWPVNPGPEGCEPSNNVPAKTFARGDPAVAPHANLLNMWLNNPWALYIRVHEFVAGCNGWIVSYPGPGGWDIVSEIPADIATAGYAVMVKNGPAIEIWAAKLQEGTGVAVGTAPAYTTAPPTFTPVPTQALQINAPQATPVPTLRPCDLEETYIADNGVTYTFMGGIYWTGEALAEDPFVDSFNYVVFTQCGGMNRVEYVMFG